MTKNINSTLRMLVILIIFLYNTQANEPNQFILDGEYNRFKFQANYDKGLNIVIVDDDSLGIHCKFIQFDMSNKIVYRLELPNKEILRDSRQVGLRYMTKNKNDLFIITSNWLYHYREMNGEYKNINYLVFEDAPQDAYVKDFDNYTTIAISTRLLPPGQDMNKWTMKTNDTLIKGVLPEFDNPKLVRFIPRQPYDVFENRVLISNILEATYYIVDLEDSTVIENNLNIFSGKSEINEYMEMEEIYNKIMETEQVIRASFIDSNRIIITSKVKRNNILELRHDIINYKNNEILQTYFEPLGKLLTNKNIKFGLLYYVSGNKIISLHRIPFTVDKSDDEYFIQDSVNNYYKTNFEFKSLIRIDELW